MKEIILSTKLRYCPRFRIHFAFLLPESIVSYLTLPYPLSLFSLFCAMLSPLTMGPILSNFCFSTSSPTPRAISIPQQSARRLLSHCIPLSLSSSSTIHTNPIWILSWISVNYLRSFFKYFIREYLKTIHSISTTQTQLYFYYAHNSTSTTHTTLLLLLRTTLLQLHTQLYFYSTHTTLLLILTHNSTSTAHTQLYY